MTIADICILIAALLPYVSVAYAKAVAKDTFNNADPRNEKGYSGKALRAYGAQLNGFESFPFFAVAVLFAEFRGAPQDILSVLAIIYILLRIAYTLAYIEDKPSLRSGIFTLSLLVPVILFLVPLFVR